MGYEQEVGCGKSVIYRINDVCVSVIIDYQNLLLKYSNSQLKIIKLTVVLQVGNNQTM